MKFFKLKPIDLQGKKLYPVSLGCPKNKSDFEKVLYLLKEEGFQFTLTPEDADLLWINTCAFIRPSVEESIEHILDLGSLKKPHQKLIVSGCLPARYSIEELKDLLPEVDEFLGIEPYKYFSQLEPDKRILSESPFYAYLKVSEGCNHHCAYCTIPKIRGTFRSKPKELLLREVQNLLNSGVKEIIIVGQDITSYGLDFGEKEGLLTLLENLSKFPYEYRIRLLYLHPARLTPSLLEAISSIPKVIPYFDIPIQHAHPAILKKMKRLYTPEKILTLLEKIRKINHLASIRTTIITGFPGEGDREFEFLLSFLKEAKFDYLGVFIYYPEEGTEAINYEGQIAYREKLRRRREILKVQQRITKERLKTRLGSEEELLILGEDPKNGIYGISRLQAPEIDGLTYLINTNEFFILPGELIKVKIVKSGNYDLWAEPLTLSG